MNSVLVQQFLTKDRLALGLLKQITADDNTNIITKLNKHAGIDGWAYEILNQSVENGTEYTVTIALYLPGIIRNGIGCEHIIYGTSYKESAILGAILSAVSTLNPDATGLLPFNGVKLPVGDIAPGADMSKFEINKDFKPGDELTKTKEEPAGQPPVTPPAQTKGGYTPEIIERMKKFKEENNITTAEQFLNYIRTWDPSIKSKGELTPEKTEQFLTWYDNLAANVLP